jgi:hypothetical protein
MKMVAGLIIILFPIAVLANSEIVRPCTFGKETTASALCVGPTKLTETNVAGKITVVGPLDVAYANIDSMEVAGEANLNESTVNANVVVSGVLNSKNGDFEGDVKITSDKAIFTGSSIKGSLTVTSPEKTPIVELHCGSTISGSVMFIGKPGVIKKSADSEISGKVKNGVIELVKETEACPKEKESDSTLKSNVLKKGVIGSKKPELNIMPLLEWMGLGQSDVYKTQVDASQYCTRVF